MSRIALNPHASTAAIPLLPPPKLAIKKLLLNNNPRGHPTHRRHQTLPVALTRCRKSQHPHKPRVRSSQTQSQQTLIVTTAAPIFEQAAHSVAVSATWMGKPKSPQQATFTPIQRLMSCPKISRYPYKSFTT